LTRWHRILSTVASLNTWPLVIGTLLLALAPFFPEPHLVQKFNMLLDGSLAEPIDIFDVFYHSLGIFIFAFRFYARAVIAKGQG